ncbi:MAG: class I SAM-dependent methyltransferase [Clostridia bacterium]|nr:class I SAM-dependent methyltransferase [Clostridia bacterium]
MKEEYNTLNYYDSNAKSYFENTMQGNFQENYDRFLNKIPKGAFILDFGCGSGRDSKYFLENGYEVEAIDGSIEMCKLASEYIGQDVKCMKFEELNEEDTYDGIWACSSILHVTKEALPKILEKMINALKQDGIIYTSFKKGKGYEIKEGKYYNFLTKEELESILEKLEMNVELIEYFETIGSTQRSNGVIWTNYIIQKVSE